MAYLLSNICTKNYWNQTTISEIIIGGWMVSFFIETQCRFRTLDSSTASKYSPRFCLYSQCTSITDCALWQ